MRHILVHDFLRIDTEIVWDVVEHDLTGLRQSLRGLLDELETAGWKRHPLAVTFLPSLDALERAVSGEADDTADP